MIYSTSFFSKSVRLILVFNLIFLWGCGSHKNEILLVQPGSGENQKKVDTAGGAVVSKLDGEDVIAVLPIENLSGTKAPIKEIDQYLRSCLLQKGFNLLNNETLEQFRKKYRMRYVGGVDSVTAEAMRRETGTEAFLITSLETFKESNPPKISLISRLVSSGSQPEIVWTDSIGLSGDEAPGLLDLGRIKESRPLLEKAIQLLVASLAAHDTQYPEYFEPVGIGSSWRTSPPEDQGNFPTVKLDRKYLPYDFFRSPVVDPDRKYFIAVVPFLNLAARKNAENILMLHYIRELNHLPNFKVIEPGLVRETLLRIRAIMPYGPSLAETDLITSSQFLNADLVLAGRVFDFQGVYGIPKVDFSVQVIEKQSRKIVFGARTFSTGNKGVYFFNIGRVFTAHNLTKKMSKTTLQLLTATRVPQDIQDEFVVQASHEDKENKVHHDAVVIINWYNGIKLF